MKAINYRYLFTIISLFAAFATVQVLAQSGQVKQAKPEEPAKETVTPTPTQTPATPAVLSEVKKTANVPEINSARSAEMEAQELLYLKNYIEEYRLGPEDIISVEVFGLPQYSIPSLIIPPDGKINYKLNIRVNARGRTVTEVEKDLAEQLNEYIIDPKVTVQLVQSHSMKYMVDGDVGRPMIYEMTRRMTIREAIVNAGGILPTGDGSKVTIARSTPGGGLTTIAVNYKELSKGKALDEPIAPGDIIFVPGNRFKTISKYMQMIQGVAWLPMIMVRR